MAFKTTMVKYLNVVLTVIMLTVMMMMIIMIVTYSIID